MNFDEKTKAEIQRLTTQGKEALMRHDINGAFDALLVPALIDTEALRLFLMIFNTHSRIYLLNDEQAGRLKIFADEGYALTQYAYGRYLEATRPDENALQQAIDLLRAADEGGVPDAACALAILQKAGHYKVYDRDDANHTIDQAFEKGSTLATRIRFNRYIYGTDGVEANPQIIVDTIKHWLDGNESDDISVVNPMFYQLLGDAYAKLGQIEEAKHYYMKAIDMGYIEAYSDYCLLHSENNDTDELKEMYETMLGIGCDQGDPSCYLYRAAFHMDNYHDYSSSKQETMTAQIREDLETASRLGSDMAPYFLGDAYYRGRYGFEQDNLAAWNHFIKGAQRDDGYAYAMLATMIATENNPYETPKDMMIHCTIMSLRNGNDELLETVVESYRNGDELADYADEIEKYYIPRYNSMPHEEPEEDDYEAPLIAVVYTDGTADIVEFDVAEGWDELPELVDAKRLDAIRVQPLYDLGEKVGLSADHITGWVDNMGLLKDLPMNPVGCRIYPGPIAGDMILTLEDGKYNPKSFESLTQLKKVVAELGAELKNVNLAEGPDDDGRYDAWA